MKPAFRFKNFGSRIAWIKVGDETTYVLRNDVYNVLHRGMNQTIWVRHMIGFKLKEIYNERFG